MTTRLLSRASRYRIPLAATLVILAGGIARFGAQRDELAHLIWMTGLALTSAPLVYSTLRGMLSGKFAADVIASITIVTALALEAPVVGLVIVVMQSGGEALERLAEGKASDALRELEERAPRIIHRVAGGVVEDVDAESMNTGDIVLVRPGEIIPCDAEVVQGSSHVDTSSITGEPLPRRVSAGDQVMSGGVNQESPITLRATARAEESQYSRIVALVREAQASKAPLQRVADRYAAWFTPLVLGLCFATYAMYGDWDRILAVLAIATPCPLILATPIAVLGGMNTAAHRQILFRNGGALETIGRATAVVFDKTGTITIGHPRVASIIATDSVPEDRLLGLASAVEQGSGHMLARTLVKEALDRGIVADPAHEIAESPGRGVEGNTDGSHVAVGARPFILERYPGTAAEIASVDLRRGDHPQLRAYVAIDGHLAGLIEYDDRIRDNVGPLITQLRDGGILHVLLLSGDRAENTKAVARQVGIDDWRGDLLPADKVEVVKRLLHDGETVVMLGDGTNDAPALSAASVGVALASHGRGIATESADVILLADEPSRLLDAIRISKRTVLIARQSIWVGLAVSTVGMFFAAAGHVVPIVGAGIQELVDLGVILNALRASRVSRTENADESPVIPDRKVVASIVPS